MLCNRVFVSDGVVAAVHLHIQLVLLMSRLIVHMHLPVLLLYVVVAVVLH
jgi:hypothetical protein